MGENVDLLLRFRVGQDPHGRWVVEDNRGLRGGLFINRDQALKFALFESGNRPQAITIVDGVFEPDLARAIRRVARRSHPKRDAAA